MRRFLIRQEYGIYLVATVVCIVLVIAVLSTLAITSGSNDQRLKVVASFYPIWFFASEIGGERANVRMLVPDNVEPHSWQPSPSDLVMVSDAEIFIYNGGGFEPWAEEFISQISNPNIVIIDTSANITPIMVGGGYEDPHFWLDPLSAKVQASNILKGFVRADPMNASYYAENERLLENKLESLHEDFVNELAHRTKNAIVTTHEGFGYLAHRYGFEAHAALGISADQMPSPQDLADLVETVRQLELHYVFAEPLYSDAVIEIIAKETGTQVLILDGLHGRTGIHANLDYFGIMYENLKNLKIGLEVST